MKEEHLHYLVCPRCRGSLDLVDPRRSADGRIESGTLRCAPCAEDFPIVRHIPRFVPLENYASNFGLEWTKHARTQYDGTSGADVSKIRFFDETKWPAELPGEVIIEAGGGSGRFTEHAASTGAMVLSLDFSYAVEANYSSNGDKDNVLIVQGDIYSMPFREESADKIYCFGVLQHTPDPRRTFLTLTRYLKHGGRLAVDIYRHKGPLQFLYTKYWIRPFTRNMDPEKLYRLTERYVRFMWPISRLISRLPGGKKINWMLLVADYRGVFDLEDSVLREWAVLDTFDMLSPAYDYPGSVESLTAWFNEAEMKDVDVHVGYNGIEGRGVRP